MYSKTKRKLSKKPKWWDLSRRKERHCARCGRGVKMGRYCYYCGHHKGLW